MRYSTDFINSTQVLERPRLQGPTVSIGVIGAGYWGRKVIREIQTLSRRQGNVRLHSVVDVSSAALDRCRQEFGPLDCGTDYASLLADPNLAAVHICTPDPTHFEIAAAFIKAGKNVLVEKPITLQSREAYQLVELANQLRGRCGARQVAGARTALAQNSGGILDDGDEAVAAVTILSRPAP